LFNKYEEDVPVSATNFKSAAAQGFIEGAKSLGFDDFSFTNLTQLNGRRFTRVTKYSSLVDPPELLLNALVMRVIFDGKKAVGVEFEKLGQLHRVYSKRIILSAGTMGSPKILLHSGIGPRDHLESVGIEVREDLPVGLNLQDHVTTGMDLILLNQSIGVDLKDLLNPLNAFNFFFRNGDGPLSLGGSDAMGFVKLNASSDIPDLSFMALPVGLIADRGHHLRRIINLRDKVWAEYFEALIGQTTISILPILLHPKSRGSIRLSSKSFTDPLLIDPNYLDHRDDVKSLISGIRILQKLVETPAMRKLGAEINPKPFPGCEAFEWNSDSYWECYLRHMTLTMYHPVGTCKMGTADDPSTVVLKNFQVKNIENLFVVDGSILPAAPSANPHAIIAMLAEKFVAQETR